RFVWTDRDPVVSGRANGLPRGLEAWLNHPGNRQTRLRLSNRRALRPWLLAEREDLPHHPCKGWRHPIGKRSHPALLHRPISAIFPPDRGGSGSVIGPIRPIGPISCGN